MKTMTVLYEERTDILMPPPYDR